MFDDVINILKDFYSTYKVIAIIILIITAIFFLGVFYNTISPLFKASGDGFKKLLKFILRLLKYLVFAPYYIVKAPFTIYKKIKKRQFLMNSIYNIPDIISITRLTRN